MNRSELITEARVRLNDLQVPYRYRDSSMALWADEAVTEASRRARLLIDNTVTVSITATNSEYPLPSKAIFIRRAKISTEELALEETSHEVLDEDAAGWEDHTGTPLEYFTDMRTGYFSIYPTPTEDATLNLVVVSEPTLGEAIAIPDRYHFSLIYWMLFRANSIPIVASKEFTQRDRRQEAMDNLNLFENEFGEKSSAFNETFDLRNTPFSNVDGNY